MPYSDSDKLLKILRDYYLHFQYVQKHFCKIYKYNILQNIRWKIWKTPNPFTIALYFEIHKLKRLEQICEINELLRKGLEKHRYQLK